MPRTTADIIREARYEDPAFTERRHTDLVLRGRIADYQKELVGKIAQLVPEELAVPYEVDLVGPPAFPFDDGLELIDPVTEDPPLRFLRILEHADGDIVGGGQMEVTMVGLQTRWSQHRWPPAWVRNNTLFLGSDPSTPWDDFSAITFYYVPSPPEEVADDTELILGDLAKGVYVSHLAYRMAQRAANEIQKPLQAFQEYWRHREAVFLRDMVARHNTKDRITGEKMVPDMEKI